MLEPFSETNLMEVIAAVLLQRFALNCAVADVALFSDTPSELELLLVDPA